MFGIARLSKGLICGLFLRWYKVDALFMLMFEWAKVTAEAQCVKATKKKKPDKKKKPIAKEEVKNQLKNLNASAKSSPIFSSSLTPMQNQKRMAPLPLSLAK